MIKWCQGKFFSRISSKQIGSRQRGGINDCPNVNLVKPVSLSKGFRKCLFLKKPTIICSACPVMNILEFLVLATKYCVWLFLVNLYTVSAVFHSCMHFYGVCLTCWKHCVLCFWFYCSSVSPGMAKFNLLLCQVRQWLLKHRIQLQSVRVVCGC